ncbi:MAG: hypothetical protein HQL58_10950 [Magnetococcales bacterium]|nr:hypothetical protein [Magnetococcales bacterium]
MYDFDYDNSWQKHIRDEILIPQFYRVQATEGRYVLLDKGGLATRLQRELGMDTIFQAEGGEVVTIEEKIVRWHAYAYAAFCLETHSCTVPGHESDGWMVYSKADYLLYCFFRPGHGLDCHLIDLPKLREWFWPIHEQFSTFGPLATLNRTMGRLVPVQTVYDHVPVWWFPLQPAQPEVVA